MLISEIIKKPLITEKTMKLAAGGLYTFCVDQKANKKQAKMAIEDFFKVKVTKIWMVTVKGKEKKVGRLKNKIKKGTSFKKAIVQLQKGQKISGFEGAEK